MEKIIENMQALLSFNNRQVIINYYEDDEWVERAGFYFESITIAGELRFMKEGKVIFAIRTAADTQFGQSHEFNYYFSLENENARIDLCFP